jgi:hypothetical protein
VAGNAGAFLESTAGAFLESTFLLAALSITGVVSKTMVVTICYLRKALCFVCFKFHTRMKFSFNCQHSYLPVF